MGCERRVGALLHDWDGDRETLARIGRGVARPRALGGPGGGTARFRPRSTASRSQACLRLESQLAAIDRGGASSDPAKAEQIKRYEDAAAKQQAELDRLGQQSQRLGCRGGGFFALFSGQSPQCAPLNNQIQQVRTNLDRYLIEIQRLQGNSGEREGQRRGVLAALGQNDCGPQYRQYANGGGPGGFFESLFGGNFGGSPGCFVRRAPTGRCACAPVTDITSRSPIPPCRASSPTMSGCASGCARPPRRPSTATATRARTWHARCRAAAGSIPSCRHAFSYRKQFNPPAAAGTRPVLGRGAATSRRPDHRARRHRGHRGAREAAVAAALRRSGQAGQPRSQSRPAGAGAKRATVTPHRLLPRLRRSRPRPRRARGGRKGRGGPRASAKSAPSDRTFIPAR